MPQLSDTGLRVLLVIVDQTLGWIEDPLTKARKKQDWIAYSQLIIKTGRQRAAISMALRELEEKGLIDIRDSEGKSLLGKKDRIGKKLFYRLKTSSESEHVSPTSSVSEIRKANTHKETNTKYISKDIYREPFISFIGTFNEVFKKNYGVTEGRFSKYKARLKSFRPEDILRATVNLSKSEFHTGKNDRSWSADPDFLLRSDEQIDKWINNESKNVFKIIPDFK